MTDVTPRSADDCACPDFLVSRRNLLRGGAVLGGGLMTSSLLGNVFTQVAYGATASNPNVVVVLSLRGGADGLSMVVPHGDPGYYAARPHIAVPKASLLGADAMFGLHPAFAPLLPMWNAGSFAAVQATGLAQPNRSHFAAMEEVEDALPGSVERNGWINRVVGSLGNMQPIDAVQLGSDSTTTSMYGPAPSMSISSLSRLTIPAYGTGFEACTRQSMSTAFSGVDTPLATSALTSLEATAEWGGLSVDQPPANGATYPPGELGKPLADAARLIRSDVGARVVTLDYGSWDMHNNLGTTGQGLMRNSLDELVGCLAAFFDDLGAAASRVTVVTISEFGRRVKENGNTGVDHGYGNAMLVLGAGINGGQYLSRWPGLGPENLLDGDLQVTTDYRSVLAELVRGRFPEANLSEVFPGFTPETVGLV